jgi:hypothetical protein
MADRNANIVISLRGNADAETRKLASSFRDLIQKTRDAGATQEQAERRVLAHASAMAQLAAKSGNAAQAQRIYAAALSQVDNESTAAIRTQAQLVSIQNNGRNAAQQFGDGLKSGLLGIVGPAAIATAAIAGVRTALVATRDAFEFKARIDATTQSLQIQLRGVRDSGQVFAQAESFAARYKLTQEETNAALLASVGILRNSTAGADELLGVLARLQVVSPEQSLQDAALAVKELQSGDITSLVKRFEISRAAANAMKKEIQSGGDAVTAIAKYLDNAGVSMDTLAVRAEGAQGKLNDLKIETENLKKALAGESGGLGGALVSFETILTRGLTRLLGGEGGISGGIGLRIAQVTAMAQAQVAYTQVLNQTGSEERAVAAQQLVYNTLLQAGLAQLGLVKEETDKGSKSTKDYGESVSRANAELVKDIQDKLTAQAATKKLADLQADLARLGGAVAGGLISSGSAAAELATKYNLAAGEAANLISKQLQLAGLDTPAARTKAHGIEGGLLDRTGTDTSVKPASAEFLDSVAQHNKDAADEAKRLADKQAAEAKRIHDSEVQLALARAKTSAERIAILQREAAATDDIAERNSLLARIESERNSGAKRHTSELNKQLNLEERIRDAKTSQLKATLDASAAIIRDRQQRRQEEQDIRTAERILRSGRSSQLFKDAAADKIALIGIEQQQRLLDINEKLATSNGQIINGRVFQSKPGAGDVRLAQIQPGQLPACTLPQPIVPGGGAGGGLPAIEVLVTLDGKEIAANVVTRLRGGLGQATSGGAGRAN